MIPIRRRLLESAGFSPKQLFAALQGAWLEPVVGNIFTDTAGTSAITTGGQAIARINDQSGGGNNGTQSTAANRPLLGRRYNLLTYSEDFSNAAWTRLALGAGSLPTLTANYAAAPDGTMTAARLQLNAGGSTSGDLSALSQAGLNPNSTAEATQTWWLKSNDSNTYIVNIVTILAVGLDSITNATVTPTWQKFTAVAASTQGTVRLRLRGGTGSSQNADILIWHPDLRLTSDVGKNPAYQRITTATDYDYGQYPVAVHDTTDSLSVSLPNLGGGVFSNAGSVYFATPVGMSALHNQSMGTSYTLPALSTDIYSWIVVPQRLNTALEGRLERYMLRKAGLAVPDYLTDDFGETITDDIGDPILAG